MNNPSMLMSLNLMTLGAVLLILIGSFLWFMRKRSNRHPMEGQPERKIGEHLDRMEAKADEHPPH